MVVYLITFVVTVILLKAFNITGILGGAKDDPYHDMLAGSILLLFLFGLAAIPFAFVLSNLFKNHTIAQVTPEMEQP